MLVEGPLKMITEIFKNNYILLIMLLQLSQVFLLCPPPPSTPTPSGNLRTIVHVHGHAYKIFGYSISYTVLHIPMAIL